MEHFFFPNSGEDQKKKSSPTMEHFFSPNSGEDLHSDAHQSQIIGGDADVDHTQIIGGIHSRNWGDISPISPGFRHPCFYTIVTEGVCNNQETRPFVTFLSLAAF